MLPSSCSNQSTLAEVTEGKACPHSALQRKSAMASGSSATCREAMDRDGETEDGGGSAGPMGVC